MQKVTYLKLTWHVSLHKTVEHVKTLQNIVTCLSDSKRGFGLMNRSVDHLQVVATNNYYNVVYFYTSNSSPQELHLCTFPGNES
jgi:hypothetical protein